MKSTVDKSGFRQMFKDRALVVTHLPPGYGRELANRVKDTSGRPDVSLRTTAEYLALFDLLLWDVDIAQPRAELALLDEAGQATGAGQVVADYLTASQGKREFFEADMFMFHVTGFPRRRRALTHQAKSFGNAQLKLWRTDPTDHRHIPPPGDEGVFFSTSIFSLANCGNRTLHAPKPSWRFNLETPGGADNRLVGMSRISLKAMYSDPSQMREALAWRLFGKVGVPAPRHTYAKLAFDSTYRGLFSVIEQIDRRFLKDYFGRNDRGNLYKAYCCKTGCATLEYKTGLGDDTRRHYFAPVTADRTYRLKSNKHNPEANTYEDLACFIRTINGVSLPGGPNDSIPTPSASRWTRS